MTQNKVVIEAASILYAFVVYLIIKNRLTIDGESSESEVLVSDESECPCCSKSNLSKRCSYCSNDEE